MKWFYDCFILIIVCFKSIVFYVYGLKILKLVIEFYNIRRRNIFEVCNVLFYDYYLNIFLYKKNNGIILI